MQTIKYQKRYLPFSGMESDIIEVDRIVLINAIDKQFKSRADSFSSSDYNLARFTTENASLLQSVISYDERVAQRSRATELQLLCAEKHAECFLATTKQNGDNVEDRVVGYGMLQTCFSSDVMRVGPLYADGYNIALLLLQAMLMNLRDKEVKTIVLRYRQDNGEIKDFVNAVDKVHYVGALDRLYSAPVEALADFSKVYCLSGTCITPDC